MATPLLAFQPVRDSYGFVPAYEYVETALEGGPSRRRRDFISATQSVDCQWILDQGEYTRLMGFFRERIIRGSTKFRVNLLTDANIVMPHVCVCSGGLPRLTQQAGNAFWVSGKLEVYPNPIRSFSLFLQNVSVPQMVDAGTIDYLGDLSEWPIGRQVLITGSSQTVSGTPINLDGTYSISTAPTNATRTFGAAAAITNPDWTVLNGLGPQAYFPTNGAAILVPL